MKTLKEQQDHAWVLAPKDAKCIVQDAYGIWHANIFDSQPLCNYQDGWESSGGSWFKLFRGYINGWDWRDTLQTREEWEAMNKQDEKWMPEVGQECELSFECEASFEDLERICTVPEGQKVTINGTADFGHGKVYIFSGKHNDIWFNGFHRPDAFRPIQPPADKYRDEQIERIASLLSGGAVLAPKTMACNLYDNQGVRILAMPATERDAYAAEVCMGYTLCVDGWWDLKGKKHKRIGQWEPSQPTEKGMAQCWELAVEFDCFPKQSIREGMWLAWYGEAKAVTHENPQAVVVTVATLCALAEKEK